METMNNIYKKINEEECYICTLNPKNINTILCIGTYKIFLIADNNFLKQHENDKDENIIFRSGRIVCIKKYLPFSFHKYAIKKSFRQNIEIDFVD